MDPSTSRSRSKSRCASSLYLAIVLCIGTIALITVFFSELTLTIQPSTLKIATPPIEGSIQSNYTFGLASRIYVVSLPARTDRHEQMNRLRLALGMQWSYFDATSAENDIIHRIMDRIRKIRRNRSPSLVDEKEQNLVTPAAFSVGGSDFFSWPNDIDELSISNQRIEDRTSDFWSFPVESKSEPSNAPPPANDTGSSTPMPCATEDFNIPPYTANLLPRNILTPARIACWHSHLSVIEKIALGGGNEKLNEEINVILEDDVDMERDIHERLGPLWRQLPSDWDIVFLGHCWSNESFNSPLKSSPLSSFDSTPSLNVTPLITRNRIHPSNSPKCTHAYALSQHGARRLLLHLRYAPFAYSRSIDHAFSWLIQSGRLKGYSVVPSVIVQTKFTGSNIMPGNGSGWREYLEDGVLSHFA